MGEWQEDQLSSLFKLEGGYAFKSAEFTETGVAVIKIKNIKAGFFSAHEFSHVDRKYLLERPEKIARRGDLLISMSGNRHDGSPETWVGKVASYLDDEQRLINQRVGALRVKNPKAADARYFGYLLVDNA